MLIYFILQTQTLPVPAQQSVQLQGGQPTVPIQGIF